MPKNTSIKKVLVIGSGPIVIGQAAEFDYAGTQACRSLKEEGIHVVLVNSNPATIMTDKDIADEVYIEPLTPEVIKKLILKVSPDSLLPTLGGQAALNIAMELDECGFLKELVQQSVHANADVPSSIASDQSSSHALWNANPANSAAQHDSTASAPTTGEVSWKDLSRKIQNTEKEAIIQALLQTNGNKAKAARLLNIDRSSLYYKLKKYNITE